MLKSTKEILSRLDAVEALLAEEITWREVAKEYKELNKDLMNRLMARNFEELQCYGTGDADVTIPTPYEPEADEGLIGQVVNLDALK